MKTFKSKSLVQELTDKQIENGCHSVRFMSFEGAIQLMREHLNLKELKDKPIGYRVTEQGIEVCYEY